MEPVTLTYREDPTTGLPRLEVREGELPPDALAELQRQCRGRYQQLLDCAPGQTFALDGDGDAELPRHYRVRVDWPEGKRCPVVELRSVEPPALPEPEADEGDASAPVNGTAAGRWQAQFLAELAGLVGSDPATTTRRSALDFVLADMRAVFKKKPQALSLLLLAGYLHAGDAICRRHGGATPNKYEEAAQELARAVGEFLPDGAFDPLLS